MFVQMQPLNYGSIPNGPEMKSAVQATRPAQQVVPVNPQSDIPPPPISYPAPASNPVPSTIPAAPPTTATVTATMAHYTNPQQYQQSSGALATQPVSAQHSVGSGISVVNGVHPGKGTSLSPTRAPRGSAKIMFPSQAPPPCLLSSNNPFSHSANLMSATNMLSRPLVGTVDPMGMMSSPTLGSPFATSLQATVLERDPSPIISNSRSMQRMYGGMSPTERKEMYSILVENGFSVEQASGPGPQRTCGGCGATSRSRSECPCGFNSTKRKQRNSYLPPDDLSNDESSDGSDSPKGPSKRVKRSIKPNTKYMDVVPVKVMTRKPPMKSCPSCNASCHTAKTQCPKCGHNFPRKPRKPKQNSPYYSSNSFSSLDDQDKDNERKGVPKRLCPSCHAWVPCSARVCDCEHEFEVKDDRKKSEPRKRDSQDMDDIPVELWSEEEACAWLKTFEFGEQYLSKFHENNVDGIILLEMNGDLMRDELGVKNEEHSRMMIDSLSKPRPKRAKIEG